MPPPGAVSRRPRAAALPPDERRSMLVDATLPLLLERGEAVTTCEIATAAGIAEGTIFRAFASKDELVEAVLERVLDPSRTEEALEAIPERPGRTLESDVTEAIEILQARVVEVWQLLSSVGPRFHRHDRRPSFDSPALTRLLERHRGQLRLPPPQAAQLLRSMTIATSHPLMTPRPMKPVEVTRHFLYGVAGPGLSGEESEAER